MLAVKLWQKFGFEIIGKTLKAFRQKILERVDALIRYKELIELVESIL